MEKIVKVGKDKIFKIVDDDCDSRSLYEELFQGSISFISNHKHYKSMGEMADVQLEDIVNLDQKVYVVAPVTAYIHGGIALSLSNDGYPFNDAFDSGLFGFLIAKRDEVNVDSFGDGMVKSMNALLNNEVYGFQLKKICACESCHHEEEEELDSCYGFYGYDSDKEMVEEMLSHISSDDLSDNEKEFVKNNID